MGWVHFDTLAHIQAAAQTVGATPAFTDGTSAVAVWYAFDAPTTANVVAPTQGTDGTYIFSTFYWGELALTWWDAQAFAGYLGSGSGDAPAGWTPYSPPLP